jgi:hypothetical protein
MDFGNLFWVVLNTISTVFAVGFSTPVHLEGLLHLSALTSAVTIGYVGLDRIRIQLKDEGALERAIASVSTRVEVLLRQLDVVETNGYISFIYDFPPAYVLTHVAGMPVKQGWKRPYRAICRQRHVPLIGYFRNRVDLKLVAASAVLCTLSFLILTAATIWDLPAITNKAVAGSLFVIYVSLLIWILISVAASYRLRHIGDVCQELEKEVDGRLETVLRARIKKLDLPFVPERVRNPAPARPAGPSPPEG